MTTDETYEAAPLPLQYSADVKQLILRLKGPPICKCVHDLQLLLITPSFVCSSSENILQRSKSFNIVGDFRGTDSGMS